MTIGLPIAVLLSLAVGWSPAAQAGCPLPVDISLDTTVMGALAPGDCTIAQLGVDPDDDAFVDAYRFTLSVDDFVTFDLQSQQFDAFLAVLDENLTTLLYTDDEAGGGGNSFIPRVPLAAGTYIILATSFGVGETGSYDLSTITHGTSNPACDVVVDLPATAVADGTLSVDDCTVAQLGLSGGDQTFTDQYRLALPAGGTLTISLDSGDFDAFLVLLDETLMTEVAFNDDADGGGTTNSLLSDLVLAPGTYVILANQFSPGVTGAYRLTLIPEPSAELLCAGALLTLGALQRRRSRASSLLESER